MSQYHYTNSSVNSEESPAHLSGFMYNNHWDDEVPTISVDHGMPDLYVPDPGAYSPSIAGTPSEDNAQSLALGMDMWPLEMGMNGTFNNAQSTPHGSPTAMSDAGDFGSSSRFVPTDGGFLNMPSVLVRPRSSSAPSPAVNLNAATSSGFIFSQEMPSSLPQIAQQQQAMFMSPTSDESFTAFALPHPGSAPVGGPLRRAASMNGRERAHHRHTASDAHGDYLHPDYPVPGASGLMRARSLGSGSTRAPTPYSRSVSPSGSDYSEAASSHSGYGSDNGARSITKAVVTTGPVAEASAMRRTHTAKFQCDICFTFLTTKTNLDGHRKSHLGVKEHKCSLCDKWFTRDWDRKRHEKTHSKAELHCGMCGKTSTRKDAFDKHRCRPGSGEGLSLRD